MPVTHLYKENFKTYCMQMNIRSYQESDYEDLRLPTGISKQGL